MAGQGLKLERFINGRAQQAQSPVKESKPPRRKRPVVQLAASHNVGGTDANGYQNGLQRADSPVGAMWDTDTEVLDGTSAMSIDVNVRENQAQDGVATPTQPRGRFGEGSVPGDEGTDINERRQPTGGRDDARNYQRTLTYMQEMMQQPDYNQFINKTKGQLPYQNLHQAPKYHALPSRNTQVKNHDLPDDGDSDQPLSDPDRDPYSYSQEPPVRSETRHPEPSVNIKAAGWENRHIPNPVNAKPKGSASSVAHGVEEILFAMPATPRKEYSKQSRPTSRQTGQHGQPDDSLVTHADVPTDERTALQAEGSHFKYHSSIGASGSEMQKRRWEPDYTPEELANLPFERLATESFDHDPHASGITIPEGLVSLEQRLDYLRHPTESSQDKDEDQRAGFFASLSIGQYEECGEVMVGQFSELMSRLRKLRQDKRKAAMRFEDEIAQRELEVSARAGLIDKDLARLRRGGEEVVRGSG